MTAVQVVRTRLVALAAVTALVGSKVYALKFPQGCLFPAVRLTQVGGEDPMHLRGSVGLVLARVQVDCVDEEASGSDPFASAHAVMDAVHGTFTAGAATGLCGFAGTVGSTVVSAIVPAGLARERYDAAELRQVLVSRDYLVSFRP